jgi:hypothetical protein
LTTLSSRCLLNNSKKALPGSYAEKRLSNSPRFHRGTPGTHEKLLAFAAIDCSFGIRAMGVDTPVQSWSIIA